MTNTARTFANGVVVKAFDGVFAFERPYIALAPADHIECVPNNGAEFSAASLATGTLIKTQRGHVKVEDLSVGDLVLTMDRGYQPIRLIRNHSVSEMEMAVNPNLRPLKIPAHALAHNVPSNDLTVSQQQRVLSGAEYVQGKRACEEVLVPATDLEALSDVSMERNVDPVNYFHILFDEHEIIWANDMPVASLVVDGGVEPLTARAYSERVAEPEALAFPQHAA
ncbi:Hint domain-containing protein [Planktotalea sp.]|uniref:Hint domain-containing protein n=1 Tax=Planktotalea sp. TaxID=2029877 RepID=UPI003299605C